MAEFLQAIDFDPRAVSKVLFDYAKRFWGWSLAYGILGPLFGLASGFMTLAPAVAPLVLVVLAVLAEALQWRSDTLKDGAESLLRKLDLRDSFGWDVSRREMSDVEAQNMGLHQAFTENAPNEPYFASGESGVRHALANLEESAWWSKHLAKQMGAWCLGFVVVLVLLAVLALVVSLEAVRASTAARAVETLHAVSNVVTSSLTLVFSLGLVRLAFAYLGFGGKAEAAEGQVRQALAQPDMKETEAVKLWQDYHLARATAPFIPTWFWRMKRDKLNAIWDNRTARS